MLYIVGLGLGDAKDVTCKGLEIIKSCDRVYLEAYTSILTVDQKTLEDFYGRTLIVADRELVESNADEILPKSQDEKVAFLVVGDPFGATTHTDLVLRAKERNIKVQIVHNASIISAVACCGLQLYSFGEVVSIPFWMDNWKPSSFLDKIASNRQRNLHTLCLLDIKVKEPTLETILSKNKKYMPPKFMTVAQAAQQILELLDKQTDDSSTALTRGSLAVGLARVGSEDQRIVACSLEEMKDVDLGPPLHCLVIPSCQLHPLETDYLQSFAKGS